MHKHTRRETSDATPPINLMFFALFQSSSLLPLSLFVCLSPPSPRLFVYFVRFASLVAPSPAVEHKPRMFEHVKHHASDVAVRGARGGAPHARPLLRGGCE